MSEEQYVIRGGSVVGYRPLDKKVWSEVTLQKVSYFPKRALVRVPRDSTTRQEWIFRAENGFYAVPEHCFLVSPNVLDECALEPVLLEHVLARLLSLK